MTHATEESDTRNGVRVACPLCGGALSRSLVALDLRHSNGRAYRVTQNPCVNCGAQIERRRVELLPPAAARLLAAFRRRLPWGSR